MTVICGSILKIDLTFQMRLGMSWPRKQNRCQTIIRKLKELNAKWNLQPTPGQAERVQLSFRESLEEQEIRLQGKGVFNMNTKIKVKISGDGTNIGKRLKIVNVTYTYETPC